MADIQDINLIIAHQSLDQASRISSVLDSSGFKVRAQAVSSKEQLTKALAAQHVDFVLAQDNLKNPAPGELLQEIRRLNRDIPLMLLGETFSAKSIAQAYQLGAQGFVCSDEDQHFVQVIRAELKAKAARAQQRDTLRRFYASENRYQQLLQYARLPMAIVQESMFVMVNDVFAELFGIDQEEAELMPVFDILDSEGQNAFKAAYKNFVKKPNAFTGCNVETTLLESASRQGKVSMELSAIKYNDEDALQIRIELDLLQSNNNASPAASAPDSGLIPRRLLVGHIESAISIAEQNNTDSALLNIQIDAFEELQELLGLTGSDELYEAFIQFIGNQYKDHAISQYQSNQLVILLNDTDSNSALENAQNLVNVVAEHLFEFGEKSKKITISVGVSLISDLVTSADAVIKQAHRAILQLHDKEEFKNGNGAAVFEPERSDNEGEVSIQHLIKQAFKLQHLQILFQPMMELHGATGKHYEVLMGIKQENKDQYPDDFIAQATRSNENHEIDRWVILEALKVLMRREECAGDERLFIHVSRQSLENPKFAAWLQAAVVKSKLQGAQLNFQLREVDVSTHLKKTVELIKALRQVKVSCIITHFGCSVQPFKLLESIPFKVVKVDGSFVRDAQASGKTEELSELLDTLKEKEHKIIVPMVESATILPTLWKSNVSFIQGYYVQAPHNKMDYDF